MGIGRRSFVKWAARGVVAALVLGNGARAFELKHDSAGKTVRWSAPIHFTVDESVAQKLNAPGAFDALRAAADELNGDGLSPRIELSEGPTVRAGFDTTPGALNANEVIALTDWPQGRDAVASTIVTVDRRRHVIIDADILLNASEGDLGVVASAQPTQLYDLQGAVTHELGHALGLMHTEVEGAVMFPKTFKGDLSKRQLQQDDLAGLMALYGPDAGGAPELTQGCSSAPGTTLWALFAALPLLFLRRRRAVVLAACLAAGAAFAGDPAPAPAAVKAVTGQVVAVSTSWLEGQQGVMVTHVTIKVSSCSDSSCDTWLVVPVLGGVDGDYEQVVDGEHIPSLGDQLGVVFRAGSSKGEIFDLERVPERTRFFARVAVR